MLTAENVHNTLLSCLFTQEEVKDGKIPDRCVKAQGVMLNMGFHPERLEAARTMVADMLEEIDPIFYEGMTFLNFCVDRNGFLWTSDQRTADELITLGVGLGLVSVILRELQTVLPGGVPYIVLEKHKESHHDQPR